jgi:hypothetical protein
LVDVGWDSGGDSVYWSSSSCSLLLARRFAEMGES